MYVVVSLQWPTCTNTLAGQPFDLWKRSKRHLTSSKNLLETIRPSQTFLMRILPTLAASLKKSPRTSSRRILSSSTRLTIPSSRSLRKRSLTFGLT
jgi:hypothetical protein